MTQAPANTARGILLMLAAMLAATLMDATAKGLIGRYDTLQVVWARYTLQTLAVAAWQARRFRAMLATRRPGLQAARSLCQLGSVAFFFAALRFIGLAAATAIADTAPMLIALGAALFLHERIGPRRVAGIAAAFLGALIIIRPGNEVFTPASLLPLAAAACYAAYAVLTRAMGPSEPTATALFYSTLGGTLVTTALLPTVWTPIPPADLVLFLTLGALGILTQVFLIRALSLAEASVVAPFGQTDLLFAATWGFLFFAEVPDRWTVLGALVIAGAGLYVWHRETRAGRGRKTTG